MESTAGSFNQEFFFMSRKDILWWKKPATDKLKQPAVVVIWKRRKTYEKFAKFTVAFYFLYNVLVGETNDKCKFLKIAVSFRIRYTWIQFLK